MPTLEITTKIGCSMNCSYCPQTKIIKAFTARSDIMEMSLDIFKKCIDKLPQEVVIDFSGMCEPWLNQQCTNMLLYAYERGHDITVFTTLVGMTKDDFRRIKHVPFKSFWIHLPSEKKLENIPVTKDYLDLLKIVFEELKNKKDMKVSFHIRGENPHPEVKKILGDAIQQKKISTRAKNVNTDGIEQPKRKKSKIVCTRGLSYNELLPNGDVSLCCMDYGMKHILGNLLESDYESLFESEEFKKITRGLTDEKEDILCRYCDMFALETGAKANIIKLAKRGIGKIERTLMWSKK